MSPSEPARPRAAIPSKSSRRPSLPAATTGVSSSSATSSQAEVRFANNTTTTNGVRQSRRVTVISIVAGPNGVAAGSAERVGRRGRGRTRPTRAQKDATESQPATDASALVEGGEDPGYGEGPAQTDLSVMAHVLDDLAGAFTRAQSADRVLAGFAEHGVETVYLGSSTGLRRRHAQPTGAFQLVGRSDDGSRSSWVGAGTADFRDVSVPDYERQIVERLGWAERAIALEAGRYEVVLPPDAVSDLMFSIAEAARGQDAEDGRSVFSAPGGGTRVGETLASIPFQLRSNPAEPGLECWPFLIVGASDSAESVFDNGLDLEPTEWIKDGVLHRLCYHRAGAARSGVPFAAPIDNLILEVPGATGSLDDLVARTERGLLLTCLWYIREVDPATMLLTGLTRDGVYLIEDGSVVGAVNNFRFNESPVDLLSRVTEVSAPTRALGREFGEWSNRNYMPALRVPDFNMSTVSQAS